MMYQHDLSKNRPQSTKYIANIRAVSGPNSPPRMNQTKSFPLSPKPHQVVHYQSSRNIHEQQKIQNMMYPQRRHQYDVSVHIPRDANFQTVFASNSAPRMNKTKSFPSSVMNGGMN